MEVHLYGNLRHRIPQCGPTYDRILARQEAWLPPQAHRGGGEERLFLRHYEFETDGLLTFQVVILRRQATGEWGQQVLATRLRPWRERELALALEEAGFHRLQFWGDMQGAPFDPEESGNLVVAALRAGAAVDNENWLPRGLARQLRGWLEDMGVACATPKPLCTWGEFFTMGLTIFASLATIWLARPVKFSPALKFVLGSIFGFIMGGVAGLIQANVGLNLVFHNAQWVVALHAHTFLLTGVGSLLFAVLYALVPMLTNLQFRSQRLVDAHFWLWMVGSVTMAYAMGMAGTRGMLRRTLYEGTLYQPYTLVAIVGSLLTAAGFVAFLGNVIATLGWRNVLGLALPGRWLGQEAQA